MAGLDPEQRLLDDVLFGRVSRRQLLQRAAALGLSLSAIERLLSASAPFVAAAPAPAATPAGRPRPGGTTVWAAESDPISLNPITNSAFQSTQGFEHSYESLTGYDSRMRIIPALAERWETPDDNTYIFHLRRGVKFHDGADFTADDVKYTFDIVLDPAGPAIWRTNFDQVDRVEVIDRNTVRFSTRTPFPPLLGAFAILRSSAILKRGAYSGNTTTQIIGTGPYRLVEFVPKSHMELAKNPNYWGAPLPHIDRVTFKVLEEEDARVAGLRSRTLDYAFLTPIGEQRLRNQSALVVTKTPRIFLYCFIFNMTRKPWTDVRVRQAISIAINRQEIIDKALSGSGTFSGPIATGFGNWFISVEELKRRWYRQDLDKAKRLLKEGGIPEGQEMDLLVTSFGGSGFYPAAAVVFKDQLAKVGINVKIRQVEVGVFTREAGPAGNFNYDAQINAFTPRHDPDGFLWARFYSKNPFANGYNNPRMDDLLLQARTIIDPVRRKFLYDEAQRRLLEESPMLWVGVDNIIEGLQTYVKGYTQSPFTRRDWGLKNAWLEK
ncbi:MAG: ABC transporter substrate-binding protein [Armatimonadota bacterium]